MTDISQSVSWAFGTLYLKRYGKVVLASHWPTSCSAAGGYDYSYSGIIPTSYRPRGDVCIVANDWAMTTNYALVQFLTDGTVKARVQSTNSATQLHLSATWLCS